MSDPHITSETDATSGAVTPAPGMDAALKAKWIEALRSGKYGQAKEDLREVDTSNFCCLGVLCDIAGCSWSGPIAIAQDGERQIAYLSERLADRVGIEFEQQNTLWTMNDGGETFSEIADYIEQHIPTRDDPVR